MLGVLILALEGYALYSFLLNPKWEQFSALQTHYNEQNALALALEKDNANKSQFQEQLKLVDFRLGKLTSEVPPYLAQEEIVLSLNKYSNDRKLKIDSLSLSNLASLSKEDFAAGKIPTAQTQNTVKGNSPVKAIPGGTVLTEDINIGFSGSYGALYNFMSDLEKSNRKIITKEVTMAREAGNLLKGEFKVQYVGYKGSDDTGIFNLETPTVNGKSSPFLAYPGYDEKGTVATGSQSANASGSVSTDAPAPIKTSDPNFYLILSPHDSNGPKVIMGDYTKNGTELYSDINGTVRGKISISGNIDKMTYSYSLGSSTQTKDAKLTMDGGVLRLDVISQQRENATDMVGITLDIDNKTDYPLEINVNNDDKNSPRFSIGNKSGSVIVK
ncbi:MAG: hypothetical protein P4L69_20530 [Desulfosporosinus sp.]|nr:hypothetical protein [Desulfosporosinus sp.]